MRYLDKQTILDSTWCLNLERGQFLDLRLFKINKKTSGCIETQGKCKQSQRKVREYKNRNRYISDELYAENITTWDYFGAPEPLIGAGRFGSEIFRIV